MIVGIFIFVVVSFLVISKYYINNNLSQRTVGKIRIVTTFYPLGEFARHITKERGEVTVITPVGSEPHDFEPTQKDLISIQKSQVFVYNGAGFEPWVSKVVGQGLTQGIMVVDSSFGLELSEANVGVYDPHIWLDPVYAQKQVDNILAGVIQADPINRIEYENNAQSYKNELAKLDSEFRLTLANCIEQEFVTSHAAFTYLAKRYNLIMVPIAGFSPDSEPSTQKLTEIVQFVKEKKLKAIFFETLVSPKLTETIATEVGVQTLVLNPLEGLTEGEVKNGMDYLSVQRENLVNLTKAFNCR
ncbi:MAG: zinc ABC transporter substrate-binding protein [Patescibacteria group bacterium]